jgi:hypothetical protein
MKFLTLKFLPLLLCVLSVNTYSQNVPDSVFIYVDAQLDASRDSVRILLMQNTNLRDTVVPNLQRQIRRDSVQIANYNRIVDISMKPAEKEPFFKWSGFWIGLNTSYGFDSIITKSTVLGNLQWEITTTARITIAKQWEFSGGAVLPLKEKFKLKCGIAYLIW